MPAQGEAVCVQGVVTGPVWLEWKEVPAEERKIGGKTGWGPGPRPTPPAFRLKVCFCSRDVTLCFLAASRTTSVLPSHPCPAQSGPTPLLPPGLRIQPSNTPNTVPSIILPWFVFFFNVFF